MDAEFSNRGEPRQPAREPFRKVDQIEELRRNLREHKCALETSTSHGNSHLGGLRAGRIGKDRSRHQLLFNFERGVRLAP